MLIIAIGLRMIPNNILINTPHQDHIFLTSNNNKNNN